MGLIERFAEFFAAANDGAGPYPWQCALVERVARSGTWPRAISAPTGSGKSSVVDIHVFLVAERARSIRLGSEEAPARPPRRLVLVAPRRVLVDDQHERAVRLAGLLAGAAGREGVLGEVATDLGLLVTGAGMADGESPLGVARLRGGVSLDLSWRLDPCRCQIICATPMMWGSRLLLRGYRGSRRARNLEAGLLGQDVAVIVDEAHLHERLVQTAGRVADWDSGTTGLQVVAMSATRPSPDAYGLTHADLEDAGLARRVLARKDVNLIEIEDWKRDARAATVARAEELHGNGTVGVFVNTVAAALAVASDLGGDSRATVALVCGRMRPADLARLRLEHPGLLDARGNPTVDYLVSTQSLEVGVDLDLPAIVSEIAPASALAQRAGRLNRSGQSARAVLSVIAPAGLEQAQAEDLGQAFAPYAAGEIIGGARWLRELGGDASPQQMSAVPLPVVDQPPLPLLTGVDLETLAMSSEVLSADVDPAFYVEEPRHSDPPAVSIAARDHLPRADVTGGDGPTLSESHLAPEVIRRALLAAPPRAHELATMSLGRAFEAVLNASPGSWVLRSFDGILSAEPAALVSHLRDGDVIVVPAGSRVCTHGVIGCGPARSTEAIEDVMAARDPREGDPDIIVALPVADVESAVGEDRALGRRATRRALATVAESHGHAAAAARLRQHRYLADLELTWCSDTEGQETDGLLVLRASERAGRVPSAAVARDGDGLVTVDDHCAAVAQRAGELLDALDISDLGVEREQLVAAACAHDEGKRHPRFQGRMGADPQAHPTPLAKPVPGHVADRGDGWRHEQLSAAVAAARHERDPLVVAIVAAHHGHGRTLFNRGPADVLDGWSGCDPQVVDELERLFGEYGSYELERRRLQRNLGIHRLAYFEALLRCADMQVSREGG